ncbi:hypothetical protein GM708_06505 [Vibrio cholerae]|nr:hypothetical protein [Vibrio cholerae]
MFITDIFSLPADIPFLDVDADNDNAVFLDGSAIRNATDSYGVRAQAQLVTFFEEVIRLRQSPVLADRTRGLSILTRMSEPGETRLGYSAKGTNGKGFGDGLGKLLWDELGGQLCQYRALTRIEHLPLFLPGIDRDLMSDMMTRVIMDILVEFTHDMMQRYPALQATTTRDELMVWDAQAMDWTDRKYVLPFVGGKQLILVPQGWVTGRPLMHYAPFYNRFTTQALQAEQTTYDQDGRAVRPYKSKIKADNPKVKEFNSARTLKDLSVRNHVQAYQNEVDELFVPIDSAEARRRILRGLPKAG